MVGVLALQGAFREHIISLEKLGVKAKEVRTLSDLSSIDSIILPGGESTVQGKLL
ncbi:MAG: pyridoxal 5'-phosphate synthase glutaminase subunit PdxT, partial [Bullifex sp.]|nr:pyridoxal 5'-phosphate synthase glutaminase subunit PdxT [Bullifex sp.]